MNDVRKMNMLFETKTDTHKNLKDTALYVLERLESAIFDPDAESEREQILVRLEQIGCLPFNQLKDVLAEEKLLAFLRLQMNGFEPNPWIRLDGRIDNLANDINLVLIDYAVKYTGFSEVIFPPEDISRSKDALRKTVYVSLL